MIKRWTIHIEAHWGYWPRFSIRRQVGHGERHVDGGVPGTLVVCKTCSGQGVLHQPDSFAGLWPNPPGPITNAPSFLKYYMDDYTCEYEIGETVHTRGRDYVVRSIGHDTDFKKAFIILERNDNSPHISPE